MWYYSGIWSLPYTYLVNINLVKDTQTAYTLFILLHFNVVSCYSLSYFSEVCPNEARSMGSFGEHPSEKCFFP